MISVLDHIEYLSHKYDCVIVPGLGAFISQYTCTKDKGMISSLKRNIAFNSSLDYNDGLLMNSLMRREQINSDEAKNIICDYVYSLQSQLKHEGEVPVGRLGYFRCIENNNLEFIPFISHKTNNEYFGLSTLKLIPLVQDEISTEYAEKNIVSFPRKFIQIAASIILLIGMYVFLSTPIIEQNDINYANFNAFTIKDTSTETIQQDLYIAIPQNNTKCEPSQEPCIEKTRITDITKTQNETGRYCIVVASLASKEQAEKFIQEKKLTDCNITKSTSKYRVYVARGSYEEMLQLKQLKYSNTDAWVCRI